MPALRALNPDMTINVTYRVCLWYIVSGSPTAGGFGGYFNAGIINNTRYIIPARANAFFLLLEPGNEVLIYMKIIPNNADKDVPNIVPATIPPPFCHIRYPATSDGLITLPSVTAAFSISMSIALSIYGSTIT